MTMQLNHTIITARDRDASAWFLADILGLPAPIGLGPFAAVQVGETSLDFVQSDRPDQPIASRHFAFLVSETEFDAIFGRIQAQNLPYWADPFRQKPNEINGWDDGRGVYFPDPNDHLLEIITRPYGSGGTMAAQPHPLIAQPLPRPSGGPAA